MKLNFKNLLKFLIPIIGLAVLGGYYRYKYVLNPDGLRNSIWLEDRVVNIPSSVPNGALEK